MTFDLQIFGGNGAGSGRKSGGGASTPSGVNYEQFMKMSLEQRYQLMTDIIINPDIIVPDYLDKSEATKVIYGLGMNNKSTVVSEAELDSIAGPNLYRTVHNSRHPKMSSKEILDQIGNSDYTQLSSNSSSGLGRAIYFGNDFNGSAQFGENRTDARMIRAKILPNSKIIPYDQLRNKINSDELFTKAGLNTRQLDNFALYAIAHGIDGWHEPVEGYSMIINRSALATSSTYKKIFNSKHQKYSSNWTEAPDA